MNSTTKHRMLCARLRLKSAGKDVLNFPAHLCFDNRIFSQLKQRRSNKIGGKSNQVYGRLSPVRGVHPTQTQTRIVQSSAIPIPTVHRPTEGPKRMSLEGENSEVQTLVSSPEDSQERVCLLM